MTNTEPSSVYNGLWIRTSVCDEMLDSLNIFILFCPLSVSSDHVESDSFTDVDLFPVKTLFCKCSKKTIVQSYVDFSSFCSCRYSRGILFRKL